MIKLYRCVSWGIHPREVFFHLFDGQCLKV